VPTISAAKSVGTAQARLCPPYGLLAMTDNRRN
jgi:hypothetical protein